MKRMVLIAVFAFGAIAARAQFEGVIRWSMTMEITDPAMKAKMADAEKKMQDPATQAKMKEMQARMQDPQFKAMMESNPALKAQMESIMKMGQGGGVSSMIPKGMTVKIKGSNSSSLMEGGMADGMEMVYVADKGQSFSVNRSQKTYSSVPQGGGAGGPAGEPTITKTSETQTILGYTCTRYNVVITERGRSITQTIWATSDLKDVNLKSLYAQRQGNMKLFHDKIEGVPLKVEVQMPEGLMVMTVTEIKKQTVSSDEVSIPSDFKETPFMGGRN